jgi:hypothetical protein
MITMSHRLIGALAVAMGVAMAVPGYCDTLPAGWKPTPPPSDPALFNFNSDLVGTQTTFTDTNGGISATFSSPLDPGGFVVAPTFFLTLTRNVLLDPGPAGASNIPLMISFSRNLTDIVMSFATDGTGPITVTAFENGTMVGSSTAIGIIPMGFSFPEGTISFVGADFNSVVLSATTPFFAVDNINATAVTPVGEPSSAALAGIAIFGLGLALKRLRGVSAAV